MIIERKTIIWLAAILIITGISLFPVVHNEFINRDDPNYITENVLIKELTFQHTAKIFSAPQYEGDYHPITLSFFAIQYHFFQDAPKGYHVVSLLLHIIATALVFIVFLWLSKQLPIAVIVSLLFGIHPTHVESVAWVSSQKDLLYTIFYLSSIFCYLLYLKNNKTTPLIAAFTLFVFSLFSKTMAVSLVGVLFLVDYLIERKFTRKLVYEKLPFIIIAIGFGIWSIIAHRISGALLDEVSYSFLDRIILAGYASSNYIKILLLPIHLSAYYPYPFLPGKASLEMLMYPLGILLLFIGVFRTRRLTRTIIFGCGFFFFNLATVVHILPLGGAFMADRYTYVSSLGLFFLAGTAFQYIVSQSKRHSSILKYSGYLILAGIICVFSFMTRQRASVWKDSVTLWTDTISKHPDVPFIYTYRGNARHLPEEFDFAIADFNKSLELKPDLGISYYSRGYAYAAVGNHEAAIADYTKSIDLSYEQHMSYSNRGTSLTSLRRFDDAIADFTQAIRIVPNFTDAYFNRANVYLTRQQYQLAIADLDTVLQIHPSDVASLYNRGVARQLIGEKADGCSDLKRASGLNFAAATNAYNRYCR